MKSENRSLQLEREGPHSKKRESSCTNRNKRQIERVYVESARKQGIPSTFTDTRSGITGRMRAIEIRAGEQLENTWQGAD